MPRSSASALRAALWSALLLALAPACSVVNAEHCGNQDGNATCLQRDPAAPYCSICVADNQGCLAAAPPSGCLADTAPATSADPITTDATATATGTSGPTGTADPTTTHTTSTSAPPTTTDPTTTAPNTGTSDTSTGTSDTSTGTSTSTGESSTGDTSTGETSTGETAADTTMGGPVCGDNKAEGQEVCDGTDLQGETCKSVGGGKWGGGTLGCNLCMSFNDTKCCVGLNGTCGALAPDASTPCCGGLTCKFNMLANYTCQN